VCLNIIDNSVKEEEIVVSQPASKKMLTSSQLRNELYPNVISLIQKPPNNVGMPVQFFQGGRKINTFESEDQYRVIQERARVNISTVLVPTVNKRLPGDVRGATYLRKE
jgi:hypothetical protein